MVICLSNDDIITKIFMSVFTKELDQDSEVKINFIINIFSLAIIGYFEIYFWILHINLFQIPLILWDRNGKNKYFVEKNVKSTSSPGVTLLWIQINDEIQKCNKKWMGDKKSEPNVTSYFTSFRLTSYLFNSIKGGETKL